MPREYTGGAEIGAGGLLEDDKLLIVSGGVVALETTLVHKNMGGQGGVRSWTSTNGLVVLRMDGPFATGRSLQEGRIRAYCHLQSGSTPEWRVSWYKGTTELGSIRLQAGDQLLKLYTGTATLVATAALTLSLDVFHRVEVHIDIRDAAGFIKAYIDDDGSYTTAFVEFTGDTKPGADIDFDRLGYTFQEAGNKKAVVDDVAINSITLKYDGGTGGAPAVGETVSDVPSTGVGIITAVEGNAVSGVLVLRAVTGTFVNNNQITTGGTFDALVDAPNAAYVGGLQPNSGFPGDGAQVYLGPTGNGATSGLTGSDGNQVDNYLLVDDHPWGATAEHVIGDVNLELDTYLMANLPSSAQTVKAVVGLASVQKDGTTINNMSHIVRLTATNYFGVQRALPTDFERREYTWDISPDTGTTWTVAEVDAVEAGVRMET